MLNELDRLSLHRDHSSASTCNTEAQRHTIHLRKLAISGLYLSDLHHFAFRSRGLKDSMPVAPRPVNTDRWPITRNLISILRHSHSRHLPVLLCSGWATFEDLATMDGLPYAAGERGPDRGDRSRAWARGGDGSLCRIGGMKPSFRGTAVLSRGSYKLSPMASSTQTWLQADSRNADAM